MRCRYFCIFVSGAWQNALACSLMRYRLFFNPLLRVSVSNRHKEISERKFFGIPLSENCEISWLFLKFIQICDGEKFVIKKFIILMQLTVCWTRPSVFRQIWDIRAVKIKFKCPGTGKFFHVVWFSRSSSLCRFAAKALRLVMNEIASVTCFENYSSK